MSEKEDAPMPFGVEQMSKQELWNWFARSKRAAAEKKYLEEKFFTATTGLHSARLSGNPYEIIERQRKRMAGLELQMTQMQKGYEKKLKKALLSAQKPQEKAMLKPIKSIEFYTDKDHMGRDRLCGEVKFVDGNLHGHAVHMTHYSKKQSDGSIKDVPLTYEECQHKFFESLTSKYADEIFEGVSREHYDYLNAPDELKA